jgi:hypothetical protein
VFAQLTPALHNPVESSSSASVHTVGVMDFTRAVDAQTDEKIVFLEKGTPVVIEKDTVGLKGVLDHLARPPILLNDLERTPEEIELHQSWFATLPSHCNLGSAVRLQQLLDVGLECMLGHALLIVRIQRFLGQKKTIFAVNIAGCAAWFRQQVEAGWRIGWESVVRYKRHLGTFFSNNLKQVETECATSRNIELHYQISRWIDCESVMLVDWYPASLTPADHRT